MVFYVFEPFYIKLCRGYIIYMYIEIEIPLEYIYGVCVYYDVVSKHSILTHDII